MLNFNNKQYFVTATGTNVGKTFFVTNICKKLLANKILCSAIKPIETGFSDIANSDAAKILQSLDKEICQKNIDEITPWRFLAPLAPTVAAKMENKNIDFIKIKDFCWNEILKARENDQFLFIEGAGGFMVPLSHDKTFLDLISSLQIPVLLLAGNYLGTISHTLSAFEVLKSRAVNVEKIIINNFNIAQNNEVEISDTISEIVRFTNAETIDISCLK